MLKPRCVIPYCAAAVLVCCGGAAAADVDAAAEYRDRGQLREAGLLLKDHLSDHPSDADARLLLAAVHLDLYQGEAAEKELRRALSAGAARPRVLAPLARALLLQGDYQRVLDEVAVAVASDPAQRAELAALRGDAERALGNRQAARAEYERALSMQPEQLDASLGQAWLALGDRRPDEARRILAAATERHPTAARAWELLAEVDFALGDYAAAEQSLVKAVVAGRNKWMPRFKRALTRLELGKIEAAEVDIEAVADEFPDFPGLLFARGGLLLRRGELDDGLASLQAYLGYDPGNVRAMHLVAVGEMERGNLDVAEDLLRKSLGEMPDAVQTNRLLAEVLVRKRDFSAAEALLREALLARPDRPELLSMLAAVLVRQGRPQEALKPALRAVELAPHVAAYRVGAAEHLRRTGDHDEALAQLEEVIRLDPLHRTAPLMRIKVLLEQQEAKPALELAEALARARRTDPYVLNALGLARLANGDAAGARASFHSALDADPAFPDAALNLAKLGLREDDTQGVRQLLEQVLVAAPGHVEAILALSELDAFGGDVRGQQRRLREAVDAFPEELRLRLALARSYLGNGMPEQARLLAQAAPEQMRREPELLLAQGQAQAATGDLDSAEATFKELLRKAPDSATPHYLLAAVHAKQGNAPAMTSALVTGASLAPDSPLLRAVLEQSRTLYTDPAKRLALFDRLLAVTDADPRLLAAKADLLVELGQFGRAQRLMRALLGRYPDDAGVMRKLVGVQRAGNAGAAAEGVLREWLAGHPEDAVASVMLAQVQAELGQEEAALALLEGLMAADPAFQSDPLILNNVAWLLREREPERALGLAERALRSDPSSAAVKDTLGILLVRAGEIDRGAELLRQAHSDEPTDPTIGFHYALALSKLDRPAEARAMLLGLVGKDFPEQTEARALLAALAE
jgi:putative PEP-CTERM system TPR-repeat lipoprotein